MILCVTVRDLLFVTWQVAPEDVAAKLPAGLEPELVDGSGLVTLAFARAVRARLGRLPVPSFSKLTVHSYVTGSHGPGLYFLEARVSRSTLGRGLLGIPFATARVRARRGVALAPQLRASIRYQTNGAGEPPELGSGLIGSQEIAYFESGGLFRLVARHAPIDWNDAETIAPPEYGPVTALGFDVAVAPNSLLYSDRVSFRAELPPARVGRR